MVAALRRGLRRRGAPAQPTTERALERVRTLGGALGLLLQLLLLLLRGLPDPRELLLHTRPLRAFGLRDRLLRGLVAALDVTRGVEVEREVGVRALGGPRLGDDALRLSRALGVVEENVSLHHQPGRVGVRVP